MPHTISTKEHKKIRKLLKELDAYALLDEGEYVKEGFYPVRMKNQFYYGLVTEKRLILIWKNPTKQQERSELLPFENIKEMELSWKKDTRLLFSAIFSIVVIVVLWFMLSYMELLYYDIMLRVFMWIMIFLVPTLAIFQLYRFFKGEPMIRLRIAGGTMILRSKYAFPFRLGGITFFRVPMQAEIHGEKKSLQDLYHHLSKL